METLYGTQEVNVASVVKLEEKRQQSQTLTIIDSIFWDLGGIPSIMWISYSDAPKTQSYSVKKIFYEQAFSWSFAKEEFAEFEWMQPRLDLAGNHCVTSQHESSVYCAMAAWLLPQNFELSLFDWKTF